MISSPSETTRNGNTGAHLFCVMLLSISLTVAPGHVLHAIDDNRGSSEPEERDPAGVISYLRGSCQVREEQEKPYRNAVTGQEVYTSTWLKTGPDSAAELNMKDGATIRLTSDSEITLHDYTLGEKKSTGIGLLIGRVDVVVRKLLGTFEVDAVTVTAGVRGTTFSVAVREDGETLIAVDEGSVSAGFEHRQKLISGGERAVFTVDGRTSAVNEELTYAQWRQQAIERIRTDPRSVLKRMLIRERMIIQRLKQQQEQVEKYRQQWRRFLHRTAFLHRQQRYREELILIERQTKGAGKAVVYFSRVRRNLTAVRSVMVLAARIERRLDPKDQRRVPELDQLTEEYRRISAVVKQVEIAERSLKRVLFLLNRRAAELREMENPKRP